MTTKEILEFYNQTCTDLESTDNMLPRDWHKITQLQLSLNKNEITEDEIKKAFTMANESDFLTGKVNGFVADIGWCCENIKKILSGKYNRQNIKTAVSENKPQSHDYDFDNLEKQLHQKNMAKLEKIRNNKKHQDWVENEFYKKYPNMKGVQNG